MPEMNTIVYIMDSARYDDFMNVYSKFKHPLKNDFIIFPNAYSFGTWTKPSSSSILFGFPARATGMKIYNDAIPGEVKNSYSSLRKCGYMVNLITANVITSSTFGYDDCFDFFCDTFSGEKGINLQTVVDPKTFTLIREYALDHDLKIVLSDSLHKKFLSEVERRKHPHITFIWSMDTHDPYYELNCDEEPSEIISVKEIREGDLSTLEKAHELHRRSIEYNLSSFFEFLEKIERQRYDDMLIFLISDHGDAFGERYHIISFRNFAREPIVSHDTFPIQEIIRIPFLIKFPKNWRRNCNIQKVLTSNSILPTIFDVLGLEPQSPFFEVSLLKNDAPDQWKVVCEHWCADRTYIALVDEQNAYQFILSDDRDQVMRRNFFSIAKNLLKQFIVKRYGVLGLKAIGHNGPAKPDVRGIKKALENYSDRCKSFKFNHSKIDVDPNGEIDQEVVLRLRGLGYLE